MLAATLLAVAVSLPLGVWPSETGPAAVTVHGVEFYVADPEDDYAIIAVQPLVVPLTKAEPEELQRLVSLAERLGADGVLLLGEMAERSIPDDHDAPLPTTDRYSVAVFVSFDSYEDEGRPAVPTAFRRVRAQGRMCTAARRPMLTSAAPPQASPDSRLLPGVTQ